MPNYKGFDLFDDIEDEALRTRNRAVVLANMVEDNTKNRLVTPKGASLILGYFNAIKPIDREAVRVKFMEFVEQRGYATITA